MTWGPIVSHIPNLNAKCDECKHQYGNHKYWWLAGGNFGFRQRGKCKLTGCNCLQYSSKYFSTGE